MIITTKGIMIRQNVGEIRVMGRNTQGVRLIKLHEGDTISAVANVVGEEVEEE
jgi:DNA gyrase subunit A